MHYLIILTKVFLIIVVHYSTRFFYFILTLVFNDALIISDLINFQLYFLSVSYKVSDIFPRKCLTKHFKLVR